MFQEKLKNFLKLFSGTILGQIAALALYPYISRVYGPGDFSKFGLIVSLTMILSVFATGQLHSALLNPESEEEAKDLIGLTVLLIGFFSFLTVIYICSFAHNLWPLPIYVFFYSLFELQKMVFLRRKLFTISSLNLVSFRLLGNGFKLLPVSIPYGAIGMCFSEIFSLMGVVAYGTAKGVYNLRFKLETLKRYWKFPVFQSFTIAVNLLINDFPILFWGSKFSKIDIGFFVLGQKLLLVPAMVISNTIQNATVHSYLRSSNRYLFYKKTLSLLLFLGLLAGVIFALFGDDILVAVLGRSWGGGREVFSIIGFGLITKFGFSIVQTTFVLNHELKSSFILRLTQFVFLALITQLSLSFNDALKLFVAIDISTDIILMIRAGLLLKGV